MFYNYLLKCFVIIDLKTGKLTHQDIGQMDMYVLPTEAKLIAEIEREKHLIAVRRDESSAPKDPNSDRP